MTSTGTATDPYLQGDHEMHDHGEDDRVKALTAFTVFPKLPPEMQDEIWKYCVLLQPRIVEVKSFLLPKKAEKNQAVILGQVNQYTRRQVYTLYGYVQLKHRKLNKTVVFNPKVCFVLPCPEPKCSKNPS
jgi:hypothetical protein